MNYYSNHIWCSSSNWDGVSFDCKNMISIDLKDFSEPNSNKINIDWRNILYESEPLFIQKSYECLKKTFSDKYSDEKIKEMATQPVIRLKKEVFLWLENNVKDINSSKKGWCLGDDFYNKDSIISFEFFFYRRRDALNFIKEWSFYKKPTTYFNYFNNIRKKLNIKTNKLKIVSSFD